MENIDNTKNTENIENTENRCYDKKFSSAKFLKPGQKLKDVITNDKNYLDSVNITQNQISDKLDYIASEYYKKLYSFDFEEVDEYQNLRLTRNFIKVDNFLVSSNDTLGAQECPFGCKNNYGASDLRIINSLNKSNIFFGTLHIHLIREHCFFEGPGLKYRLEPIDVIKVLQL